MRKLLRILFGIGCLALSGQLALSQTPPSSGLDLYLSRQYERAGDVLLEEARTGDAVSQYLLGTMYQYGHGIPRDLVNAAHWHRLAADQGFAPGQSGLAGVLILLAPTDQTKSSGVALPIEVLELTTKAAEQGWPLAEMVLGLILEGGDFAPPDLVRSRYWLGGCK